MRLKDTGMIDGRYFACTKCQIPLVVPLFVPIAILRNDQHLFLDHPRVLHRVLVLPQYKCRLAPIFFCRTYTIPLKDL